MAKPCFYIDGKYLTNDEMIDWASKVDFSRIGKILPQYSHPVTPFKKTDQWVNLAARRMMRYAAENGFDRIAWTNGEQQADRYDLSKQVSKITSYKTYSGGYYVTVRNKEGKPMDELLNTYSEKELADTFGKDIAKSIIDNSSGKDEQNPFVIEGNNLKVGGSGMKAFYDAIVPSAMSKLGKPFGAKVESIGINTNSLKQGSNSTDWNNIKAEINKDYEGNYYITLVGDKIYWSLRDGLTPDETSYNDGGSSIKTFETKKEAEKYAEKYIQEQKDKLNTESVQSIPVTESMKKTALEGLPLFEPTQTFITFTPEEITDETNKAHGSQEKQQEGIDRTVKTAEGLQLTGYGNLNTGRTNITSPVLSLRTVLKGFKEAGYINFNGTKVTSHQDIADLWSIHRSPYIEKGHVVFIKDGVIVGTIATTANKADVTKLAEINEIIDHAQKLGATGVYLLHNHPSGNPVPSSQDIRMTLGYSEMLDAFGIEMLGHVVVDHDKYSLIDTRNDGVIDWRNTDVSNRIYQRYIDDNVQQFDYSKPQPKLFTEREVVGKGHEAPEKMFEIGKTLLSDPSYKAAIVFLQSSPKDGYVVSAHEILPDASLEDIKRIAKEGLDINLGARAIIIHDGSYGRTFGEIDERIIDIIDTNNKDIYHNYMSTAAEPMNFYTLWAKDTKPIYGEPGHETETMAEYATRSTEYREKQFIDGIVREEREKEAQEAIQRGDTPIDHEAAMIGLDMALETAYDKLGNLIGKKRAKDLERVFGNREMWQDAKYPVKVFLDYLRSKGAVISAMDDYFTQYTQVKGKNQTAFDNYLRKQVKPLNKWIKETIKNGVTYREIENYAMLKRGIELNAQFKADAKNKREDYAGLYAIAGELYAKQNGIDFDPTDKNNFLNVLKAYAANNGIVLEGKNRSSVFDELIDKGNLKEDFDKIVENYITDFEGKTNSTEFWKLTNAANDFSLEQIYRGGLISKDELNERLSTSGKSKFYIPLRGHEAEAEKQFDYTPNMGVFFSPVMIGAKGRVSRAENPFGYMVQMAQSSIVAKNRNLLNQTLLRVARADKTGLISYNKTWYIKTGTDAEGKAIWEEAEIDLQNDNEVSRAEFEAWEKRMQEKAKDGEARQFTKGVDLNGLFIKKNQKKQHSISISAGGVEYQVYINGNPKVSRAINGLNISDSQPFLQFISKGKSVIGKNVTSRNPAFMASNFSRDFIFASTILSVKEGASYTGKFLKNIPLAFKELAQYQLNPDTAPQYVTEFFQNGAETGYSHLFELQDMQKEIDRAVNFKTTGKDVFEKIVRPIDIANKIVENATRLATYKASRETGRTIVESVRDAKEVTLNFNTSGAGGGIVDYVRSGYLFINVAVQALNNFGKIYKEHPIKMTGVVLSYALAGLLLPLINAMLSGDDDEYWNLPEWDRQNNICIWMGTGFIKIPLPQELRAFNRIGDNVAAHLMNRKPIDEVLVGSADGLLDLLPMNPMGSASTSMDWQDKLVEMTPDMVKPVFQIANNKTFTGSPIAMDRAFKKDGVPQWRQNRTNRIGEPKAPVAMMFIAKTLNDISGGSNTESGVVDINPDRMNHLMRGYLGGIYTTASEPINSFTKRFYTGEKDLNEKATGGNLGKAYKKIDQAQEKVNQFNQLVKDVRNKQTTIEKFTKDTIGNDYGTAKKITIIGGKVATINKLLKDPLLTPEDKKSLNETQKTLLQMIDSIELK